jgi:hypothetical protein
MSIHQKSEQGAPPGHMHRPRRNEMSVSERIVAAQKRSENCRKVKVTLDTPPWQKGQRHG